MKGLAPAVTSVLAVAVFAGFVVLLFVKSIPDGMKDALMLLAGGGFNGNGAGAATISNVLPLSGGIGGNGGSNPIFIAGGAGGGGSGGYGAVVTGSGVSTNTSTIAGGNGGAGGSTNGALAVGGGGGGGGVGVQFTAAGAVFTNSGNINGGNGGALGTGAGGNNVAGAGGAGIVSNGGGVQIITSGTIAGGTGFGGQANAIALGGGSNTLTILAGASFVGNVVASGGGNTLVLGGNADQSFAVSSLGAGNQFQGFSAFSKTGSGTATLTGTTLQVTPWTINAGLINFSAAATFGTGQITLNGGGLQWASGTTTDISSRLAALGAGGGVFDTNANNVTLASPISGTGALIKQGLGTLTLAANNLYSGGTTVTGGLIGFASANNFGTGNITLNGGGLQWAPGSTADISSKLAPLGAGGGTFDTNSNNIIFATGLTGTGGLTKQGSGLLNLTGASTYTGPTSVNAGILAVNGSITSNVTVGAGGTLGGTGTIFGAVNTQGTLAPGNSIGTITVSGSFVQAAGSVYQVEANAAGQSDRINVTGAPGTATINGGTVQVIAAAGSYANSTTYTILNATGGRTGTYSGVSSNFAFLTPSLSYDANNVFLTLAMASNAFSNFGGNTPNQKAVGWALDASFASASGDFATVTGALLGLNTVQGPLALTAISGEPWADFGTMNANNGAMFMNAVGQQMANARTAAAAGTRVALAEACDVASCEPVGRLSAWISGLGGLGSVLGDGNASTLTYNFGGAAIGMDYRLDPRVLVGLSAAYTSGTQWVNGFQGKGWSNSVALAAYGSFTQAGFYADALAGWANFTNQLQRQIQIPGLQPRQANGSTSANQFLGQVEGGYKVGVYAPAAATITPFARFAASSVTQNALSEWGANALSLNVQQQTTNSLRTTVGAEFGSAVGLGNQRNLDLALRLGWQHEFAYTGRPITAAFAGAPANSFTVYGATPQPDAAVIGFSASTTVAAATQLYLRYDGEVGNGTDNHALSVGLRLSF